MPWPTTPLSGELALALVGTNTDLYTVYTAADFGVGSTTIERINPATGKVAAVATISGTTDSYAPGQGRPVIADGLLWLPSGIDATGAVTLRGMDLSSLHTTMKLIVRFFGVATGNDVAAIAVAPDGTLYLGAGNSYMSIDPTTGRLGARTTMQDGQVGGLAVAPDDSRVYVGVTKNLFFSTYGSNSSFVQARDPLTGALIGRTGRQSNSQSGTGLGGIESMIASYGGVWVSNQSGPHGESVRFIPIDLALRRLPTPDGGTGGGGALALATSAAGAVWIGGGNHGLSCLDPTTGALRATTAPSEPLTSVTFAGQRSFAILANTRGVVGVTPPAVCVR